MTRLFLDGIAVFNVLIINLSTGSAILMGFLFGPLAALGIGSGAFLFELSQSLDPLMSLVTGATHIILVYLAYMFWERGVLQSGEKSTLREYIGIIIVSSVTAASILSWEYEILGLSPFYISFMYWLANFLIVTILLGSVIYFASSIIPTRIQYVSKGKHSPLQWKITLVPVAWAVLAIVGSLGFRIRERHGVTGFRRRNIEFVYNLIHPDIFGQGGRRAQVIFGAFMLAFTIFLLVYHQPVIDN